jgi:hypothetical protein
LSGDCHSSLVTARRSREEQRGPGELGGTREGGWRRTGGTSGGGDGSPQAAACLWARCSPPPRPLTACQLASRLAGCEPPQQRCRGGHAAAAAAAAREPMSPPACCCIASVAGQGPP